MEFIKHYLLPSLIKVSKKVGLISAIVSIALFELITVLITPGLWFVLLFIFYAIIDLTCLNAYEDYKNDQKRIEAGFDPIHRK